MKEALMPVRETIISPPSVPSIVQKRSAAGQMLPEMGLIFGRNIYPHSFSPSPLALREVVAISLSFAY